MPIMVHPRLGSVLVANGSIAKLEGQGFTVYNPPISQVFSDIEGGDEPTPSIPSSDEPESVERVDINNATMDDLIELPQIGAAIAKRLTDQRPFENLQELIERFPRVNWVDLEELICLSPVPKS